MRSREVIACMVILVPLLRVPPVHAKEYAVLISASATTADDAIINSEFWYDLVLQYTTLIDEGYSHDDIYVLYGYGSDFSSNKECYTLPYTVTDQAVNRTNIQNLFSSLSNVVTEDDFLYVWWMGHGGQSGEHLRMLIETTMEEVRDDEFAAWVGQITDYDTRAFSIMTCFSGGILDDLEGPRSIVMSSSTFHRASTAEWLCDSWHAEFHYYESVAFHWETPCGICGSVDADDNSNAQISFAEAFAYTEDNVAFSPPLMSDQGGLAPDTYLWQQVPEQLHFDLWDHEPATRQEPATATFELDPACNVLSGALDITAHNGDPVYWRAVDFLLDPEGEHRDGGIIGTHWVSPGQVRGPGVLTQLETKQWNYDLADTMVASSSSPDGRRYVDFISIINDLLEDGKTSIDVLASVTTQLSTPPGSWISASIDLEVEGCGEPEPVPERVPSISSGGLALVAALVLGIVAWARRGIH